MRTTRGPRCRRPAVQYVPVDTLPGPARQEQRKQHDREAVDGMSQEDRQPLHLGDFDEHESEPDRGKKEQMGPGAGQVPARAREDERQPDAEPREHDDRDEEDPEHADGRHVELHDSLIAPPGRVEDVAQPEHVEEERPVVGRRGDVQRMAGDGGAEPLGARDIRERLVGRVPRALDHLELHPGGDRLERIEIAIRQRIARDEQRADAIRRVDRGRRARAHDGDVIARPADAHLRQRRRGERGEPVDLARPLRVVPARDGQDAARREVLEKGAPRFDRVQRALGQHECAARRRRPGIDQRNLNDVGALVRPCDEAPRFVVDEPAPAGRGPDGRRSRRTGR